MDFDINDIPVELEGINIPTFPGPSTSDQGQRIIIDETNISDKEASDDDDEGNFFENNYQFQTTFVFDL